MSEKLKLINEIVNSVYGNNVILTKDMRLIDIENVNSLNIVLLFVALEERFCVDFPLDFVPVYFSEIMDFLDR